MASQRVNLRLFLMVFIGVLTLLGLALLPLIDETSTLASDAALAESPVNLDVSPGESGELVASWEAPASQDGPALAGRQVQWKSGVGPRQPVTAGSASIQYTGPEGNSNESGVYTWHDGDRTMRVRLVPKEAVQESAAATEMGDGSRQQNGSDPGPSSARKPRVG